MQQGRQPYHLYQEVLGELFRFGPLTVCQHCLSQQLAVHTRFYPEIVSRCRTGTRFPYQAL
jgi:hypothetical protein